ncbi:MAG TPA: hypothetical protein VGQ33_19420 [Vicinamibacteria bacterium]|nr:hypothetical protein [Vicinamibacteria bacterium]
MKIIVSGAPARFARTSRADVVRRVLLAVSRFSPRLQRVTVQLAEPANGLGGVDQRCRMRAWLSSTDDVRAEAINGSVDAAVARAAAQLAKRVASALEAHPGDGAHAPPRASKGASPRVAPGMTPKGPARRLALRPPRRARSG